MQGCGMAALFHQSLHVVDRISSFPSVGFESCGSGGHAQPPPWPTVPPAVEMASWVSQRLRSHLLQ